MKKLLLIIIFVLVFLFPASAQNIKGKEIRDRDVEWSDFTGEIDKTSKFDAWTYWVTSYSFPPPQVYGNKVSVRVTVRLFLRADSWVKPNKQSDRLLKHEQGHYRIGRIFANQFEETVNSTEFSRSNYAQEIDALYWKILDKYKALNKQYDEETNHFNNQTQQKMWDKKLEDLLYK